MPFVGSPLRDRSILVTGASGYLGSAVAARLVVLGARVIGFSRTRPPVEFDHWEPVDLRDRTRVDAAFRRWKPELVFHVAGATDARRVVDNVVPSFDANAYATVLVLEACKRYGCERFVYCASMEAPEPPYADTPASPYGASKWVGAIYTSLFYKVFQLPTVILRTYFVYGPGWQASDKLVPYVVQTYLRRGRPRLSSPRREMDWVFIDDVVDAFLGAACHSSAVGCQMDIGTGRLTSIGKFVKLVRSEFDRSLPPLFEASPSRAEEVSAAANTELAMAKIGWAAVTPLEEGVRRTVNWYRQHRVSSPSLDTHISAEMKERR